MNEEMKFTEPEITDNNPQTNTEPELDPEIEAEAEDAASRLYEEVRSAAEEAKLEKLSMPSPKTARLSYSAYSDMRPDKSSVYAPASIGAYLGLILLTSIPVMGFIVAVIFACAAKRLAVKRLMIAVIVSQLVLLTAIAVFVCVSVFALKIDLIAYLKEVSPLLSQCVKAFK